MAQQELRDMLCCPETRQKLVLADVSLIETLNKKIIAQKLHNRGNKIVTQKIEAGLLREDRKFLYPVRNDIPVMLIEEAIPLVGVA